VIRLDVFSDIACPWCYVGSRRIAKALAAVPEEVQVSWRAFALNPAMPPEGKPVQEHYESKFGSPEQVAQLHARMREVGEQEGIAFDYDRMPRIPNTLPLHAIVAANAGPRQTEIVEALFRAYFEDGVDMGDLDAVYAALPGEVNRPEQHHERQVAEELELANRAEIHGVPTFVADGVLAMSGAHEPELIVKFLEAARERAEAQAAA
jgi:predicted DsbA family dithiol-disulfide isomerase